MVVLFLGTFGEKGGENQLFYLKRAQLLLVFKYKWCKNSSTENFITNLFLD